MCGQKKIAQQFPGVRFFFLPCTQFSSNNQIRKIQDPKDFQSCLKLEELDTQQQIEFLDLELLDLEPLFRWVCQDSSAESDPPRRSSKTASVRKPPETADTAEVWDREPGDGVRSKTFIVLLLYFCIDLFFFTF